MATHPNMYMVNWLSQVKQDYQTHHVNVITENSFEEISVVITHGHI